MRHPPDRRLDRPDPTDAELREDKLRDEYERAKEEEARRARVTAHMRKIEDILEDAVGREGARRITEPIWRELNGSGRAA